MIVYVETNFVVELAFLREEYETCEQVVRLAEAGSISLVLPAFSVSEPYEALVRRFKKRNRKLGRISEEINELARSNPYKGLKNDFKNIRGLLEGSIEAERVRFLSTLEHLLNLAIIIPFNRDIAINHLSHQRIYSLSPQDAIVLASILAHLRTAAPVPKYFLEQDKHFFNPDIQAELVAYDCQLAPFQQGLALIQASLPPTP